MTMQEKIEIMLKKSEDILNAGKSNAMTLDEAIQHCLDRAVQDCSECAKEHQQLAEWLQELKTLRNSTSKVLTKAEALYPYKQVGNRDSYSKFNEGWSDAVDYIASELGVEY